MARLWMLGLFIGVLVVAFTLSQSSITYEGEDEKEIEPSSDDKMSCDAESCPASSESSAESLYKSNVEDSPDTGTSGGGRKARREERRLQNQSDGTDNDGDNDNGGNNDGGNDDGVDDNGGNKDGGNDDGGNDDGGNNNGGNEDSGDDSTGGGRRRRNRGNANDDDDDNVFTWERDVGGDDTVTQSAEISQNGVVVTIKSKDDDLDDFGFHESVTTYDYTSGTSVVAIQPKGRTPCFLTEETLSYPELLGGVLQLRGSVANRSEEITLDGTGPPLSREDENIIFTSNPEVKQTCGRGNVVVLAEVGDLPPYAGETKEIKVLTYDAELTILAPAGRRG